MCESLAESLIGTERHDTWVPRGWWARYLALAGLLAAILLARRPDVVLHPQFWAEDGFIYFRDDLLLGFPRAVLQLYQGFPHLGQRLIAALGGLAPVAAAPRVYTTAAIGIAALAIATFILPRFRHLVRSDALRLAFCLEAVCMPADQEVFATPANVGWFLGVWLLFASLSTVPRATWSLAGLLTCAVVVVLSTPLAPLIAPLWVLYAFQGARRNDRQAVVFGMVLLAALAVLFSMTRRLGAMDAITVTRPGDGVEVIAFRWANLATAVSYAVGRCIVSPAVLTRLATLDRRALQIGAFAVLAFVVGVAAVHGWRRPVVVTVLLLMMIGELALVLMARPFWNLAMEVPTMWQLPGRYLVFPICCALLSVVVILDGLAARWPRVAASAACAVVVALAWWPSFAIAPLPDLDWPYWAARLQAKLETGNRDPLVIPMNPGVFPIRFDTAPKP